MAAFAFADSTTSETSTNTYTFTDHAIGTASADRKVVVCITSIQAETVTAISSVTIGGNAATQDVIIVGPNAGDGSQSLAAIYSLNVAAGTTATIVVTFDSDSFACSVFVYALTGVNTASTTNTASGTTSGTVQPDVSVNVTNGDVIVAVCMGYPDTSPGTLWSGATEGAEEAPFGDSTATCAAVVATSTQTPWIVFGTMSLTGTGGTNVSWASAAAVYPATAAASVGLIPVIRQNYRNMGY